MTDWPADRGEHWLAIARSILPATRRAEIRAHLRALTGLDRQIIEHCAHLDALTSAVRGEPFQHAEERR
ncbi:hypothetical protein [Actinoplanes sp. NPDC049118]|uniref:hypothetical protein n=1 Tax=Actinoplanes sp. NPDC049118 TaxID=3155769 RepID=UPI0033FCCD9B